MAPGPRWSRRNHGWGTAAAAASAAIADEIAAEIAEIVVAASADAIAVAIAPAAAPPAVPAHLQPPRSLADAGSGANSPPKNYY